MGAILSTIISAFSVLISFFRKFFPWIGQFTTWLTGFFTAKTIKVAALLAASVVVIGFITTFLNLLVSAFATIIDLINMIFTELRNNNDASCIVFWLNRFGFVDGFNLALPVVLSTFTLVLSFLLYRHGSALASKLYNIYSKIF